MKTAKQLKCIADEKNELSKELVERVSDACFEKITELFEIKMYKTALKGGYTESMDVEPYIQLGEVPYNKRDEVHKLICNRIRKYYKRLGFTVEFYDNLCGRLYLQVRWG